MIEAILEFISGLYETTWQGVLMLFGIVAIVLGILWPSGLLIFGGIVSFAVGYFADRKDNRRD